MHKKLRKKHDIIMRKMANYYLVGYSANITVFNFLKRRESPGINHNKIYREYKNKIFIERISRIGYAHPNYVTAGPFYSKWKYPVHKPEKYRKLYVPESFIKFRK